MITWMSGNFGLEIVPALDIQSIDTMASSNSDPFFLEDPAPNDVKGKRNTNFPFVGYANKS